MLAICCVCSQIHFPPCTWYLGGGGAVVQSRATLFWIQKSRAYIIFPLPWITMNQICGLCNPPVWCPHDHTGCVLVPVVLQRVAAAEVERCWTLKAPGFSMRPLWALGNLCQLWSKPLISEKQLLHLHWVAFTNQNLYCLCLRATHTIFMDV